MSEPERTPHPEQPAEGADIGTDGGTDAGEDGSGRTPHPEQPAEGQDVGGASADTPG
jgi:ribokinase